jgi:hypothetical protein
LDSFFWLIDCLIKRSIILGCRRFLPLHSLVLLDNTTWIDKSNVFFVWILVMM